jgi:NAD+ kinase
MNIQVLAHPGKMEAKIAAAAISDWLEARGHNTLVRNLANLELVLVIGGDGFTVRCAGQYSLIGVPIIAINAGDIGFLTRGNINNWEETLELIVSGKYHIEKRMGLDYEYKGETSEGPIVNDVYLRHTHSMASLKVSFDGITVFSELVVDGLIVGAPTGSTGYNASAGGPIIQPGLNCLTITPICQYHFNARPLVVTPDTKIEIEVLKTKKPGELVLMADGKAIGAMDGKEKIIVKKHKQSLLFAVIDRQDFYRALQQKKGLMS